MNINKKIAFLLPATVAVACGYSASKPKEEKPLNIIYIMTDDHAQQTISCYDNRYINTPNLDRLANEGVRFTNSFVSNSISGPSRAVLLTGKFSHLNGKKDNYTIFNSDQQTFNKLLQNSGYETAIIGKWHLDSNPQGFDFWEILPGQGSYYNPDFITEKGKTHYEGYVTNVITNMGINWLENRDKDKPFCMLLHHKAVHRIWMSDTTHVKEFEDQTFPYPKNFQDDYAGRKAAKDQKMSIDKDMDLVYDLKMDDPSLNTPLKGAYGEYKRMNKEQQGAWDKVYKPLTEDFVEKNMTGKELVNWKYQRYMRDYLKCVRSLDDNIGRLMQYLEEMDMLDNTVIIYASDQGFYMGEHGWFDKRFMYEESMRTPLIVRLPNKMKQKNKKVSQLVQNIDYAPTILDLAGVSVPEDMQGVSLKPLLQGENSKNWRKSLYYHYYEHPSEHSVYKHYGVRTDRYKLIHFYGDVDIWEMYDLKRDPMEMNNIHGKSDYTDIQINLHAELDKLRKQYKDNE